MRRLRKPPPVRFNPPHRPRLRLRPIGLACSCGLTSWRRCPDRRSPTEIPTDLTPPVGPPQAPAWRSLRTDAYPVAGYLTPGQARRGNGGHW